jgi:hypothetical protein
MTALAPRSMTDEQRKSVILEHLHASGNGGMTSTGEHLVDPLGR